MIPLGLSAADRRAYENTLRGTHRRRVTVDVLWPDETVVSSITPVLVDGSVTVDWGAEVTRSASLSFLDPNHALNFDTDSPDDGAVFLDRMIRVKYGVYVQDLDRWVWVSVFTGPVTSLSREQNLVQIEAQGKEVLASGACWTPFTVKKGAPVGRAIRNLMRDRTGEHSFDIPNLKAKTGRVRSLGRYASPWNHARSLARSVSRQLFYDGRGVLRLRRRPQKAVYTFHDGPGGSVVTAPSVSYTSDDVKNVVEVTGARPKGSKKRVRVVAIPPSTHPLAPWRLGRNGVPRRHIERVNDDSIKTRREAARVAKETLNDHLREVIEVQFDSLPIPHLDPGDLVRVKTEAFTADFRLRQFTIPLTPGSAMPVGYLRNVTPNRKRIRK